MKKLINILLYLTLFLLCEFFLQQALRLGSDFLQTSGRVLSVYWYYVSYPIAAFISWGLGRRWLQRSALKRYLFCALLVAILTDAALAVGTLALLQLLIKHPSVQAYLTSQQGANLLATMAVFYEFLAVAVFVLIFSVMIGKKVRYIDETSARVAHMNEPLPVKGDDEITELCKSINRMWTELQEKRREEKRQNELQTRMIGDISHDLRTPLTTIQGYIDLLEQDRTMSAEDRLAYLKIVQRKLSDLNGQINQLFDYTKLHQTDYSLKPQRIDAAGFLEHICSSYRLIFEQAGFLWRCTLPEKPLFMEFDPQKIGQAMENLLENALKYAIPKTEVRVLCEAHQNQLRLKIANRVDASIQEALPHLFERFYRADQARPTGGTGLGLPIVKKIIELHGGSITARYDSGYLTFHIALPRAASES